MKGCLNKIIWFLIIAFIALFAFNYFSQNNSVFSEAVNSIAESSSSVTKDLTEKTSEDNIISNILESFGFNTNKPEAPTLPTTYKPMLSEELVMYPPEPLTVEDFRKVFLYMANQNLLDLTLYYDDSYKEIFEDGVTQTNLSTAFDEVVVEYVDLFSGVVESQYQMEGNAFSCSLTIHLGSQTVDDRTLIQNQSYFEQAAFNINTSLYQNGTLDESMNDKQKAKVLFGYVTKTLEYDTTLGKESYTGYGAVKNKTAVCQGYTALYNYLLKLNNIDCYGQAGVITESNTQHIWTVANLDGKQTYIDVTFGDPTPDMKNFTDYTYFDVSKEFLSESRSGVE